MMFKKDMWYILEDFDDNINCTGKNILALTPKACYELDKRAIKYSIIEDFYDDRELMDKNGEYFFEQLQWFKDFDDFLKENITVCKNDNIDLAKAHYYQIAFFMDSLIICSYVFSKFLKNTNPASVTYVYSAKDDKMSRSIYDLPANGHLLVREIFLNSCKNNGIEVKKVLTKEIDKELAGHNALSSFFKNVLLKLNTKAVFYLFKYKKIGIFFDSKERRRANALFLHAGTFSMDHVIEKCIAGKWNVFFKDKKEIYLLSGLMQKSALRLDHEKDGYCAKIRIECARAYASLKDQKNILDWIDKKCRDGAGMVFMEYLQDFMKNICPETLYEHQVVSEFLKKKKIDFVVARSSSERESIGSLLAAKKTGVKRVCFQHGCSPYDFRSWHITELALMDIYLAADTEARKYFQHVAQFEYAGKCKIFESSHYLKSIKDANRDRRNNVIIYAPHKIFPGFRSLNNFLYSITWYYKLQRSILDFFGNRKDCALIFKIAPGQNWLASSTLKYIKEKEYKNILVEDKDFNTYLNRVDKVLLDYPSTALYEASAAGVPTMSLCPDYCPYWPGAMKVFGRSIMKFSIIEEAMKNIEEFMAGDADLYKTKVPITDNNFIEDLIKTKES